MFFTPTGTLPEDWALLPLEVVRLDQNMLQGEVPAAWFAPGPLSSSLKVLTLWDNKLSGSLPDTSPGAMKVCLACVCVWRGGEGEGGAAGGLGGGLSGWCQQLCLCLVVETVGRTTMVFGEQIDRKRKMLQQW